MGWWSVGDALVGDSALAGAIPAATDQGHGGQAAAQGEQGRRFRDGIDLEVDAVGEVVDDLGPNDASEVDLGVIHAARGLNMGAVFEKIPAVLVPGMGGVRGEGIVLRLGAGLVGGSLVGEVEPGILKGQVGGGRDRVGILEVGAETQGIDKEAFRAVAVPAGEHGDFRAAQLGGAEMLAQGLERPEGKHFADAGLVVAVAGLLPHQAAVVRRGADQGVLGAVHGEGAHASGMDGRGKSVAVGKHEHGGKSGDGCAGLHG
jgi:hypothetical protein